MTIMSNYNLSDAANASVLTGKCLDLGGWAGSKKKKMCKPA